MTTPTGEDWRPVNTEARALFAAIGGLSTLEIACLPDADIDSVNRKAERLLEVLPT